MNPHENTPDSPRRTRRSQPPIDADWLNQVALRYAARWETSAHGLATHLERKIRERCEASDESSETGLGFIPAIVERLVELGYVNDERFAAATIGRLQRQGRSRVQIEARLRAKGVSPSVYDELLIDHDAEHDARAAWRLARRRRLGPYCLDPAQRERDRDRHLGVLARQGFDLETAERIIDAQAPLESL